MRSKKYIEICGDMVHLKDLVFSIVLISTTTMVGHSFAPTSNRPLELLFGLGGAVLGFMITLLFVKVKRTIQVSEDSHD
jgi:hypothetical protein